MIKTLKSNTFEHASSTNIYLKNGTAENRIEAKNGTPAKLAVDYI